MKCIDEFLTSTRYKICFAVLTFFMVCITDVYKNNTYDLNFDNSTIYEYSNSNVYKCYESMNNIYYYKLNNGITYGILLFMLLCANFTSAVNRSSFCVMAFAIMIISFLWSICIVILQLNYNCMELLMDNMPTQQFMFYLNFVFNVCLMIALVLLMERKKHYTNIDEELPRYTNIINDTPEPPPYTQN